ncbi:MAG TPA: hypothetical protein VGB75_04375 [Jatrophihabitans sp.]|jgi:hypothetical protein|uniref:hypothetical protein n=1 Tax=Jatrophihabitans sp. TaxID=1932789 RepID=UPI002F004DBA
MSVPPLFRGLFDDAALFPPGNAPMAEAVVGHARYRQDWYADLVARFVCPVGRLSELDSALAELAGAQVTAGGQAATGSPAQGSALEISMTVPGGPADLAPALTAAEACPRLRAGAIELPVPAAELPAALDELGRIAQAGMTVFVEVAVSEVTRELAAALRAAGLGLKLRTGGGTAADFPDTGSLAQAIEAAVAAGVRFKCTAGLHNALGHVEEATGWAHHGFLNVLLAVHAAQSGAAPAAQVLASRDGAALAEQARDLSPSEVSALRAGFASIGSCSVVDPLTDLTELGLVSAA